MKRRLRFASGVAVLFLAACGRVPESTEQARGILEGPNVVLALSVLFVVLATGLIVAAIAADRFIRSRRALTETQPPEPEEEEGDEVVAGITVGRAPVPRWLYAAYVLIPIFAFAYVFSNVAPPAAEEPEETAAPAGPCTECEIAAVPPIAFDKTELVVPPSTEITVAFANDEQGVPHTFTVWESKADAGGGEPVADSGNVPGGGARDVQFESPESGSWYFNCTIHPAMEGDIVVEEAAA